MKEMVKDKKRDAKLAEIAQVGTIRMKYQEMKLKNQSNHAKTYLCMKDFYEKHAEFMTWLWEAKHVRLQQKDTSECRKWFFQFAASWNRGTLSKKYYDGINSSTIDPTVRTSYKWSFVNKVRRHLRFM